MFEFSEIKKDTHLVLKMADIRKYLDDERKAQLDRICIAINFGRHRDGKSSPSYLVCNHDEPYASEVLAVILRGEADKNVCEVEESIDFDNPVSIGKITAPTPEQIIELMKNFEAEDKR